MLDDGCWGTGITTSPVGLQQDHSERDNRADMLGESSRQGDVIVPTACIRSLKSVYPQSHHGKTVAAACNAVHQRPSPDFVASSRQAPNAVDPFIASEWRTQTTNREGEECALDNPTPSFYALQQTPPNVGKSSTGSDQKTGDIGRDNGETL